MPNHGDTESRSFLIGFPPAPTAGAVSVPSCLRGSNGLRGLLGLIVNLQYCAPTLLFILLLGRSPFVVQ